MDRRKTSPRRRRPSRRGGRSRHGSGNSVWYLVIGACVLLIAGAFGVTQTLLSGDGTNERTLCRSNGPINVTSILLDLTDPLSRTQQGRLRTVIENEIAASTTDTMIALGVVSEFPNNWGAKYAKCKPATGADANPIYENPTQIAARYNQEFLTPIKHLIDETLTSAAENKSPIMEALQSLIAETPDFTTAPGQKKIIVVSDMLQNSDELSFYRSQGWDYFVSQNGEGRLARSMSNVNVEILRIPRSGGNTPSPALVDDFWTRYFDLQGSRAPRVSSLGDL